METNASPAPTELPPSRPKPSILVTVIAWIGILGSGFGTFIIVIMLTTMGGMMAEIGAKALADPKLADAPWFTRFMFEHFQLFLIALACWTALSVVFSVGLLKRKNWARLVFVAGLLVNVVFQIGSTAYAAYSGFEAPQPGLPPEMQQGVMIGTLVLSGFYIVLNLWLARVFTRDPIRMEFVTDHV